MMPRDSSDGIKGRDQSSEKDVDMLDLISFLSNSEKNLMDSLAAKDKEGVGLCSIV